MAAYCCRGPVLGAHPLPSAHQRCISQTALVRRPTLRWPSPTVAASRSDPISSAPRRRDNRSVCIVGRWWSFTDLVDAFLQPNPVQRPKGQARENIDPTFKSGIRMQKRTLLFCIGAFDGCRVFHTPVRRHRLTGPVRTDLAGRVVTDRKNEVEIR